MVELLQRFVSKKRSTVVGLLVGLTALVAGAAGVMQPATVSAQSCDKVNIVYCGLPGSDVNGLISSFKADYNRGTDNGHSDLKTVYNWAGANATSVSGMNSSNTKLGTMYKNGDIKVGSTVVGTDAWVSARFTNGSGFTQISSGVWARKTTTSLAEASAPVLIHFNANGVADFAVMTGCGNAVKFTPPPTPPKPKPALSCTSLAAVLGDTRTYTFTAQAAVANTTITKYVFTFGDGTNATVTSGNTKVTTSHKYAKDGTSYTASVTVYDAAGASATAPACSTTFKTLTPPPALTCVALAKDGSDLTYKFTAQAAVSNTTITKYVFTYSDGSSKTVTTGATTASDSHTFAKNDYHYVISVAVSGPDKSNVTSAACQTTLTTPKVQECKPGIPTGDARCTECKPGVQTGSPECTECKPGVPMGSAACTECLPGVQIGSPDCTPTIPTPPTTPPVLPNTGAGNVIGLFGVVIVAGGLTHQLFLRKFRAQQ
jgi:hypothetical protein